MPGGFDVTTWSPRRLHNVAIAVSSVVVLLVALAFITRGWQGALVTAVVLGFLVLWPLRRAVVRWWSANAPESS